MNWKIWFRRGRWEQHMDREFRFHLESRRAEYIREGLAPDEAELRARRDFGPIELAREECRQETPGFAMEVLLRDTRYALRWLRWSPAFTVAAITTLAFGIGANTALFQLLDAVRLRALPIRNPQTLVMVQLADRTGWRGSQASQYPALTNPLWEQFRDTQTAFSGALAWGNATFGLTGTTNHLARGLFVSGDYFRILGVQPLLGRVFQPADDRRGCGVPGVVISYAFWQWELGGDPNVIGRKLMLNDHGVDIIGVTPAGFFGLEVGRSYDVAVPICSQATLWDEGNWLNQGTVWWLNVMGRLTPGDSLKKANALLRASSPAIFQASLPANYPLENVKDYLKFRLAAARADTGVSGLRTEYGDPLVLLLGTSGLVLLIACANLANLILARASTREHEFAVRLAIGASRGRLIRQLMVESLLLAAGGAAGALLVAGLLSRFLLSLLATEGDPLFLDLHTDIRMLAFTAAVATVTCVLFGLAPAFRATRVQPADAMKTGARTTAAGRGRFDLRQVLAVAQVTLSVVLVAGAFLFSASLRNLLAVDTGFRYNGLFIANLDYSRIKLPPARRPGLRHDLVARIRAIPGVVSAAETGIVPLSGSGTNNRVWPDGSQRSSGIDANFNWLGPGAVRTMAIALLAGRDFNEQDTATAPRVAIINQEFARRLGMRSSPIGMKFRREATPSEPEQVFEIVGLVQNTKYYSLRETAQPIAFLSIDQAGDPDPFSQIVVRSASGLRETTDAVRHALAEISPVIRIEFQSFEGRVREGLLRERLMATLSGYFGGLAALISAIGVYGVMSYFVVRRTSEFGIRIALGAERASIIRLVLRQAGVLLGIGAVTGIALTVPLARTAQSLLFGLKPYDVQTLALATGLLALITAGATYLPARRAARMDPMTALRDE